MSDIVPIRVALSVPVRVFVRVLIRVRVSVRFPVCPSFATPSMCCVVHVPVPWAPASACFITRSCANPNMCRAWPTERVSVRVLVRLPERVLVCGLVRVPVRVFARVAESISARVL